MVIGRLPLFDKLTHFNPMTPKMCFITCGVNSSVINSLMACDKLPVANIAMNSTSGIGF